MMKNEYERIVGYEVSDEDYIVIAEKLEMASARFNERHYYEPELDLDGTSEDLYTDARNGYIDNPDALHRLGEILTQEGKTEEAERVGYMEERENEDTNPYSIAEMKLDYLNGYHSTDEITINDDTNFTVIYEQGNNSVVVSLSQMWQDGETYIEMKGVNALSFDEFKNMNHDDFERFLGAMLMYSMVEEDGGM